MWSDVVDLRQFYRSPLGQTARRAIRRRLREMWPDVRGESLLSIGYATPYLRLALGQAERVIALMPAGQGVIRWPPEGPNLTLLADEAELPLPDMSVGRVVLLHAIEHSEQLRPFLREVWRVLTPGGRVIAVVPNRRGLWARFERTPFGHGHPYTADQISRLLRDNLFEPLNRRGALFMPPFASRRRVSSAQAWERIGERWFGGFAGVVLVEAGKQLYAPSPAHGRARRALRPAVATPG
jgi:SAM-dependent methyltransferase